MLAHNTHKSRLGDFGFDTINIFTNDEIYCTGFHPTVEQIESIGHFIESINRLSFSKSPICLYVTKKNGLYWMDLKLFCLGEAIFADAQEKTFSQSLCRVERKAFAQIPKAHHYGFDLKEISVLYN